MNDFERLKQNILLTEMPQHYAGNIIYQKDSKFTAVSISNISRHSVMGSKGAFIFILSQHGSAGWVFGRSDVLDKGGDFRTDVQHALPVMTVSLRDSGYRDYKQAHHLRIRETYSGANITSDWYKFYLDREGAIVSDKEHLEGGRKLWESFIKMASSDASYNISLVDSENGETLLDRITVDTDYDSIWSKDETHKNRIMVLTKK